MNSDSNKYLICESLLDSKIELSSKFIDVLALLDDDDQKLLLSNSTVYNFSQGSVIYAEGDIPQNLMFLNTGKVKIFKNGVDHKKQIIRLIKQGWFFGYRAMLADDDFYQSSSAAFEESQIISIPKEIINDLIHRNHELSNLFIHILASNLAKSNDHTLILTQKHLRGRLASAILILEETYGFENDGKTLSARIPRGDLAELANMNIANTSRVLGEFVKEGMVSIYRRTICILDKKTLERTSVIG